MNVVLTSDVRIFYFHSRHEKWAFETVARKKTFGASGVAFCIREEHSVLVFHAILSFLSEEKEATTEK